MRDWNRRNIVALLGIAAAGAALKAKAQTAPPNYPNLLDGYQARPCWQVAGVDFYVGCQPNDALASLTPANDGSIDAMPGFTSRNPGSGMIRFDSQDNLVFDSYDFSVDGGYWFYLNDCNNVTFSNCLFAGPGYYPNLSVSIIQFAGSSAGFTMINCTVDGGASVTGTAATCDTLLAVAAPVTLQNNWFKGSYGQYLSTGGNGDVLVTNNLFDETYVGIDTGQGIHMNYMQWDSGDATPTWQYNTTKQSTDNGAEGPQFYFNNGGTMNSPNCSNNTMISVPTASGDISMSYMIHGSTGTGGETTTTTGSPTLSSNYMDFSGAYGPFYPDSFSGWAVSGNIDMRTGISIDSQVNSGSSGSSGGAAGTIRRR